MTTWLLHIEVLEDLHIGTGTGWGDIDAQQVGDRHQHPVIPASHIKGVWRDAAMDWFQVDPGALKQEDIDHIFGRAGNGQGQLQLGSAYLSEKCKTLIWGSTSIDVKTRTAREKSLHFIEYVPAGTRFEMQVALNGANERDADMLLAIIARCSHLGSRRSRGHGRVRWSKEEMPLGKNQELTPPSSTPARLRLLLRNPDPICLAHTAHPGNIIATESLIRGRSLRGALTAACLAQGKTEWAKTLLDTRLAWGDALPLPASNPDAVSLDSSEVLPIPLSLGTPKATAKPSDLPWWADGGKKTLLGQRDEVDQMIEPPAQEKLKRPAEGEFVFRSDESEPWQRYQPQILERLHTAVPNRERTEQALFSTEEIAENTLFLADLLVFDQDQAFTLHQIIQTLGSNWLRVGRGGKPLCIEASAWLPPPSRQNASADGFVLLLESDLIARDAFGNGTERLDAALVAALAGCPDAKVESGKNFSEGISLYGFNIMTGLPRQTERAIKAGSVIRIEGEDASKVRAALAQRHVLGELPEEGFGRFRLDALPMPQRGIKETQNAASYSAPPRFSGKTLSTGEGLV